MAARPVLKAFARSRRRPVRRDVKPLSRFRLFLDEWFVWRVAAKVDRITALHRAISAQRGDMEPLSDAALRAVFAKPLRAEHLMDPARGAERFCAVLEVFRRETGLRLRDNQIECALRLLSGTCVELRTGEGKTLAAGMAAVTAASVGVSVHVVTVNDYLAERDHELIAPMAQYIGVSSAVIRQDDKDDDRRAGYDHDILYGTNKTVVFDHLRDKREARTMGDANRPRQTGQALAIIDEADSVLIDDATVPMILSEPDKAPPAADTALFRNLIAFARDLSAGGERERDKHGSWRLTTRGIAKLERQAAMWRHPLAQTSEIIELTETALMAIYGFLEGVAYVVQDDEIVMIDQATGRLMPDRKWDYGLQQMVEFVAGVPPSDETRTVGQITQQTYFRQYRILSGLTGTAKECRGEFWAIYGLAVWPVAAHAPNQLFGKKLRVFRTEQAKWQAVAQRAVDLAGDRAVLIGLNDVAESGALQKEFRCIRRDVAVLDALSEAQEAELVEVAGERGAITIATHLAGRGTDIALASDVRTAGGLHVIIASIMPSGRLERQLYGRAGRQGDPGSFDTMISLEDRGLVEGAFSFGRRCATWMLRRGLFPAFSLGQIQADRDRRARAMRRRTLLREQDMIKRLGYR
ncbi:MAG: preprotein translocase subunit SecA [Roseicyclus sp.]|nr:preprotein translocase subunit SecA [Roseicyclus sp.]